MIDLRKILIILIIGVLYVVLAFAVTNAIHPKPNYDDVCRGTYYSPFPAKPIMPGEVINCTPLPYNRELFENCSREKGFVESRYDTRGCEVEQFCNTCNVMFENANKKYEFVLFLVFSTMGLMAVIFGLYLSPEHNELNKWIGSGFVAGGLAVMFTGTAIYYSDLYRLVRPFVIAAEIAIVIIVFYREMSLYKRLADSASIEKNKQSVGSINKDDFSYNQPSPYKKGGYKKGSIKRN